jgi:S1-C subfamily serine protease
MDDLSDTQPPRTREWRDRLRLLAGRSKTLAVFALGVLASLTAILIYNAVTIDPEQLTVDEVEETVAQALASATSPPAVSAQVYQVILPSLVIIQTEIATDDGEGEFGLGSGVIVNDSAAILTALHIVAGATEIQVRFADGTESRAFVVVEEPENDIAVLVPADLPAVFLPATLGSIGALRVGDEVFAVGNPLGLAGSMSAGVISGFERTFTPKDGDVTIEGLIQFDAAVNPGNSGGPLLNRLGQVVGIVTGLVNPTDQEVFIGIGFAVPIDVAAGAAGGPAQ